MTDILFNRDFAIQLGAIRIAARQPGDEGFAKPTLKAAFSVDRNTNRDPNTAEVKIHNLSETKRKSLEEKQPLIIEAGYTRTMQHLFSGDITYVTHNLEGPDWVTTIQCGDGSSQFSSARINISYAAGAQMKVMMKQAAEALGVGIGNAILQSDAEEKYRQGVQQAIHGAVNSGRVSDVLDKICSSAGYQWSIQDGELQLFKPGETSDEEAISLSPTSGLIGSPETGEDGIVKAKSLLQGGLKPNRLVQISAAAIEDGFFKVEKVQHVGDTWGNDWYSEIEAKPI